jgi:translation initiation factor 4G
MPSQGNTGRLSSNLTRSQRHKQRNGGKTAAQANANAHAAAPVNLGSDAPLKISENSRKVEHIDSDSPEAVDWNVRNLLSRLTMEKFDLISVQIIEWANKSEKEKDGRTLIQVVRLVFEKATDEATWSQMYARLCHEMMEKISDKVQDDGIKNQEGKPIAGGQLFRKYLLDRCREVIETGWVAKEVAAAAATKAKGEHTVKAVKKKKKEGGKGDGEVVLDSDGYHAAQKAKRQGLGLITFLGELFKLQMLPERNMHKCVKVFLDNMNNPEEEDIEGLCKLLTTVGSLLDTKQAHTHMDVYFRRMTELAKSPNLSPRMQFMLQVRLQKVNFFDRGADIGLGCHRIAREEMGYKECRCRINRCCPGSRSGMLTLISYLS